MWTSCMLFFQTMLLAGYAYAHWLGSRANPRLQSAIHLALLAMSLAFLPVSPNAEIWKTASSEDPTGQILLLLAGAIGGPYLVLSATAPLLQRWFHATRPGESPWRLYALSNGGSFLALLSYPFLIEPLLRLRTQTAIWTGLYMAFAALCGWVSWGIRKATSQADSEDATPAMDGRSGRQGPATTWSDTALWVALSACSSVLLLATTNQVSQEVAVIPFLWVAPLTIYLLTFVFTFAGGRWYPRLTVAVLAGILAPISCIVVGASTVVPVLAQLLIGLGTLFVICMLCHGEVFRLRPPASRLTGFYLAISLGGALGGIFSALIAPRIFTEYHEYPVALAAACALGFVCWLRGGALHEWTGSNFAVRIPMMAMLMGTVTSAAVVVTSSPAGLDHRRNFYGILRVSDTSDDTGTWRQLTHGRTRHGMQFLDRMKRLRATSYYGPHSGVALGITSLPKPRRVAVVGLGAGTLAAWGREGDTYRFYEINPDVAGIAREWFTYLSDSKAHTEIVLGDARVQLRRELAAGRSHDFDFIAVDAFSSDSIPIHLLTAECGDLYRDRLAPGGILALHISNRSINLEPVTRGLARHLGWQARMIVALDDHQAGESSSRWVLLTQKAQRFEGTNIQNTILGWGAPSEPVVSWTDDFASIWPLLRLSW